VSVCVCVSECGGMRGCSGADEYEAGKEKKSQYTHYKKLDYTTGGDDEGDDDDDEGDGDDEAEDDDDDDGGDDESEQYRARGRFSSTGILRR